MMLFANILNCRLTMLVYCIFQGPRSFRSGYCSTAREYSCLRHEGHFAWGLFSVLMPA